MGMCSNQCRGGSRGMDIARQCAAKCGMRFSEEELGLRNAWNAGWARHYAAGGPTPGQMGQAYQYGRAITAGMGGAEEEEMRASPFTRDQLMCANQSRGGSRGADIYRYCNIMCGMN